MILSKMSRRGGIAVLVVLASCGPDARQTPEQEARAFLGTVADCLENERARVLGHEIVHPRFGYRVRYRRVMEIQARLFGRFLLGELTEYPDFTTR